MAVKNKQTRQGARYNRLAIAAAGLAGAALLSLVLLSSSGFAVFAVGAGHVALAQIQRRRERGRGLAVAALAIGYAIAGVALMSMLSLVMQPGW